jgi:hypothetical protein
VEATEGVEAVTSEEKEKLLDIRKRGKRGKPVSMEEHAFCTRLYNKDPQGYAEVEQELLSWVKTAPWWELLG